MRISNILCAVFIVTAGGAPSPANATETVATVAESSCPAPVCHDYVLDSVLESDQGQVVVAGDYTGLQLRMVASPRVRGTGAFAQSAELVDASGQVVAVVTSAVTAAPAADHPQLGGNGRVALPLLQIVDGSLQTHIVRWGGWEGPVQAHITVIPVVNKAHQSKTASTDNQFVSVPEEYIYDPALGPLHDYCTVSPDSYRQGPREADFRGPCAYHDLCYAQVLGSDQRRRDCNPVFQERLGINCSYAAGGAKPYSRAVFMSGCYTTAWVYRSAVDAWTWT